MVTEDTAKAVKDKYDDELHAIQGVHSTSVALVGSEIGIRVYIDDGGAVEDVPDQLEGIPVETVVKDYDTPDIPTATTTENLAGQRQRHRPVQPGISANHIDGTSCTMNYIWTDGDGYYVGGNNHCFGRYNEAESGDPVLQPSPNDGGASGDRIAGLTNYIVLQDGAAADFAWAELEDEWSPEIYRHGPLAGDPEDPSLGDTVSMSGRTTGTNEAQVFETGVRANVNYGDLGTLTIYDCFRSRIPSDGGDSGSPVVKQTSDGWVPCGVHFAGATDQSHATHCKVSNIMEITGLEVVQTAPQTNEPTCLRGTL